MEQFEKILSDIYYDPSDPGSFGGVQRLTAEAKKVIPDLKQNEVVNWLKAQDTYTLFRQARKNFPRLSILAYAIDHQWQADLLDMTWFSKENDNYRYLLVVVDVLSRFAWVLPLKDKSGDTLSRAFESIFDLGRVPKKLQTDQGREFVNKTFKNTMEKHNINFFTTTDDTIKCAIAERFNRTLRTRIYRYLYHTRSKRYIDALSSIVSSYNHSYHRSIKMSPSDVNDENVPVVIKNLRKLGKLNVKDKLDKEKYVRISRKKGIFEKGATENFTEEVFKINSRKKTPHKYIYRLVDLDDEPITSLFYPEELQPVPKPDLYKARVTEYVDKKGKKRLKIHFIGFPAKYDKYIEIG
uniref:Integrase catalytic domain-containing protein n=1 Tax=Tetranychus urticae TaxID=32264 RepID=A0A158P4A7_TETUR